MGWWGLQLRSPARFTATVALDFAAVAAIAARIAAAAVAGRLAATVLVQRRPCSHLSFAVRRLCWGSEPSVAARIGLLEVACTRHVAIVAMETGY